MIRLANPALLAALGLATLGGVTATAETLVDIGQPLRLKSADYGPQEITELTTDLRSVIDQALARSHAPDKPVRVQLVLQDATPNRPTIAELGRRPGLSERSIGLGGAWIAGTATFADGRTAPISFSFYETNLRYEFGPSVWSDANRAFDMLASSLAHGKTPNQANPMVSTQSSFGAWPG